MRKWKERVISLLLVVAMVFGLAPANLMTVQAAEAAKENLGQADGIVWLTKNEDGGSVSDEFGEMVEKQLKLDDMVREALGITDSSTKVYFDGVNVGDAMDLFMNMDKIESMVGEMKDAITSKEFVVFNIGSTNGEAKKIAFRSMEGISIYVGKDSEGNPVNKIYVDHAGAPESSDALKALITDALNNADITVEHNGKVVTKGFYPEKDKNVTRYEATKFQSEGGVSYKSLLKKWPSVTASPDSNEKKAGEVYVTIKAAEYSQYPEARFTVTEVFEVIMRDQRITVNAAAKDSAGNLVQDSELAAYTATYSGSSAPTEKPVFDYYKFVGWEAGICPGYDYTAIMKAKVDNNKNGLADQLETLNEYTVSYYVDGTLYATETVTDGGMPKGPVNPTQANKKFVGWETESGAKWPAKVTGDVNYIAKWVEESVEIQFSVTGTLIIDRESRAPQTLTFDCINNQENIYRVVDPGWARVLKLDGYSCVGWYYKVPAGEGADLNKDGVAEEVAFDMSANWDADTMAALDLYCEFLPAVEITKPDGTVEEVPVGEGTKVYTYSIETAAGKTTFESLTELSKEDVKDLIKASDDVKLSFNERIASFKEWKFETVGENTKVTPVFTYNVNKVAMQSGFSTLGFTLTSDDEGVVLTNGSYKSYVNFDCEDMIDGNVHTYAVDAATKVDVSPFRNTSGDIYYYVKGLTAKVGSRTIDIPVSRYDENFVAYFDDVYATIKGVTRSAAGLSDVTLVPLYAPLKFTVQSTTLPAAQQSYGKAEVFNTVIKTSFDGNDAAATVQYKAQEDSYDVKLYKLFDLLDADGLGVLKSLVDYDSLTVAASNDTWLDIEDSPSKEVTAQEAADKYITDAYHAYNADPDKDIFEFIGDVVEGLGEAVYANAYHKFGYVGPTELDPEQNESLRIAYTSNAIAVSKDVTVNMNDGRANTTISVDDVTCTYGESVIDAIMEKAAVSANGVSKDLLITYDANNNVRDFSKAGVGEYNVKVAFKGNTANKPALSNTFKLTVKAKTATVTVESLIAEIRGDNYYNKAEAKVTGDAPIIQIVAGIANEELAYGLNTEGSVKDWSLGFDDNDLMVDAWVKLPQSYIKLLTNLEMKDLEPVVGDLNSPIDKIVPGTYYTVENLLEALEDVDADTAEQIQGILNMIPEVVADKLGISDLTYSVKVRFDALETKVYPTEPGFYVNYASTLSALNTKVGKTIDKNYEPSEDYGFIVISPMVPIPNRGGVQLFDGTVSNAQNVFVYEYNGKAIARDLEVAVKGEKLDGETPFYYGLTTRFDATKAAPVKPGVYFAGYNYTGEVFNADAGEMEVRRLGSDSAIIIIKQREAELTITGGIFEYEENVDKVAEVKITDKNGVEIKDSGVTVISGTVNVNDDDTNVTADDFYGTVNIDLPNALEQKWNAYCAKTGYNNSDVIRPGDFVTFLEICGDEAETAANNAMEEFKALAMKDAVSKALGKINVSASTVVGKTERAQDLLQGGKAYYDELVKQFEPLNNLNNNLSLTFYDLETETAKLEYDKTGYYLYIGVITDPDLTVDTAKGMVIIHSADDYIMFDKHVPYNGQPQKFDYVDETGRGDVSVMVDRQANEITFFLDDDVYKAVNAALKAIPGVNATINEGSDANVTTCYKKAENIADKVTDAIVSQIKTKAINKLAGKFPAGSAELSAALDKVNTKLDNLTVKVSAKLQELDKLPSDTTIILYNKSNADDLQGMPVNVGTYEFYGYDYDVAATRGKLIIEPVYIFVEDEPASKYVNDPDPELVVTVGSYSYEGTGADVNQVGVTVSNVNKLVSYSVGRTPGEEVGVYDIIIKDLKLLDNSGNYILSERTEDLQDFRILPVGEFGEDAFLTLSLEGEVFVEYVPDLSEFNSAVLSEGKGGLAIWDGKERPASSAYVMPGAQNCTTLNSMYWNDSLNTWSFSTMGIPAKEYGDTLYMRPFIELEDGSYITGGILIYSPETFCKNKLNDADTSENLKVLCASILEYGSAAQEYFDYKDKDDADHAEDLVNFENGVKLNYENYFANSEAQLAYSAELLDELVALPSGYGAQFEPDSIKIASDKDFTEATLTLEGAVVIDVVNYNVPVENIDHALLQVWSEEDLFATKDFTYDTDSCTMKVQMNYGKLIDKEGYVAALKDSTSKYVGVPAKECGDTVYFMTYYVTTDGTIYRNGMRKYSPDEYVRSKVEGPNPSNNEDLQELCMRLAVYSEKARTYFNYKPRNN